MGALTLSNVTKSFGKTEVIKGVDLTVADGEFCVFVGPSGCGKSTLLRMIAGLEHTTGGTIEIGPGEYALTAAPAGEGDAKELGQGLSIVADITGPGKPESACLQQDNHLGQMLVFALARENFIADDD